MIFVTVGTHNQSFDRLIKKMDEIAAEIDENVIMQIGHTLYEPTNVEWFRFIEMDKIVNLYQEANIIVSHAGAGSILDALKYGKSIILVPRLKKHREHIDDQQLELSEALEKSDKCLVVYDIQKLGVVINNARKFGTQTLEPNETLSSYIKNMLDD